MPTDRVTILCVCTGNVCRSPAAERLLRDAMPSDVGVMSMGTHALVGQPISPPMDELLELEAADAKSFRARQLTPDAVRGADLILTMARDHRWAVVDSAPAAVRRTFTLREYARLLATVDPKRLPSGSMHDRLRASIPLAAGQRRALGNPLDDDVVDPFRLDRRVYERAFHEIAGAVKQIQAVLTPLEI